MVLCNAKKIAITGKARSGKTELSHYAWMLYGFKEFDFSAVLKDEFHRLFPHIPRDPKPRAYYQKFGQWLREVDSDIWLKMTMAKVHEYCFEDALNKANHKPKVLVNGVRQPNEYQRLKDEGFVVIRVNTSDDLRIGRAKEAGDVFIEEDLSHETESHIGTFEVDYEVSNVGTIGEMYNQFDAIMRDIGVQSVSNREIVADAFGGIKAALRIEDIKN
jgi:dephospho-CoA kinase